MDFLRQERRLDFFDRDRAFFYERETKSLALFQSLSLPPPEGFPVVEG